MASRPQAGRPRVTVAIPLHRSAPFVDVVSANIERITENDVEVLVSDRTLLDDTLDVLQQRHGADPRITFLRATDDPGWVDHYNALLRRARGRYFMWMAHDDDFPPGYVTRLSAALDARPDALLAFGPLRVIDLDGRPVDVSYLPELPIPLGRLRRADEAIALLHRWNLGVPSRGLCRRDEILRRRLTIRHTRRDVDADAYWVLGIVASGPLVFEPGCPVDKRIGRESGSAHWPDDRRTAQNHIATVPLVARYLLASRVPLRDTARVMWFITARSVQRVLWLTPERVREAIPKPVRHSVGHFVDRIAH